MFDLDISNETRQSKYITHSQSICLAIGQAFGNPLIICGSEDVDDDANDVFDGVHNYEVITKLGFRR